ncbi:MAG: hypothetical protein AAF788_06345 [Pseudomonadota bacterium]
MFNMIINDLLAAIRDAAGADPLLVLVPLLIVAIFEGLSVGGIASVPNRAFRGLMLLGPVVMVWSGLVGMAQGAMSWPGHVEGCWNDLMGLSFIGGLGYWLLLLAAMVVVVLLRTVARR